MLVAFEASGLRAFLETVGSPLRFSKDVLRVGRFVLPDGRPLAIYATDLEAKNARANGNKLAAGLPELAANTNKRLALGHRVWFPEGDAQTSAHNQVASLNRGYWSAFRVEGDRLVATVDVLDDTAKAKVGSTIRDVSAGVVWGDLARASDGTPFDCAIEHVCATSNPVVPRQNNFERVALAREVPMTDKNDGEKANLSATTTPTLLSAIVSGLGLPEGSDEAAAVSAFNEWCAKDEPKVVAAGAALEKITAEKTDLERTVESLKVSHASLVKRLVTDRVELARDLALKNTGEPIGKDDADDLVALLSSENPREQALGERALARLTRSGASVTGKKVETSVDLEQKRAADADNEAAAMLEGQGYKVARDSKGRPLRKPDGSFDATR